MKIFHTGREAKEFVIGRLIAEAEREVVPLSELERKMMYFSETHWTLPDMDAVVRAFDEEHDRIEYERKIGRLAREYSREARRNHPRDYGDWRAALSKLRTEDHYVLVVAEPACDSESAPLSRLPKLILIGFLLAVPVLVIVYFLLGLRRW